MTEVRYSKEETKIIILSGKIIDYKRKLKNRKNEKLLEKMRVALVEST